jgi:gliding motility-associated-like protein
VKVPQGFSPNGDGINDKLVIKGLSEYPNHRILIFNRWGNKVYEASPYKNDWDGKNQFGVHANGDALPDGTYFYILELGPGYEPFKGYIYIKR